MQDNSTKYKIKRPSVKIKCCTWVYFIEDINFQKDIKF